MRILLSCDDDPQIRVFDNGGGSTTDDSFNVFIDGVCVGHVPAENTNIGRCFSRLSSGQHTLRVQFVGDIDDSDGMDSSQEGSYTIELLGVAFVGDPVEIGCTDCKLLLYESSFANGEIFPPCASVEFVISVAPG